nr:acetyl-coenzyme A synthetase N-terminal domain-containing protein [Mycobacterium tuberculosis]
MAFWAKQANRLSWTTPFTEVLDWSGAPFAALDTSASRSE